ncbi:MAG TPA: hypothetical protein VNI02_01040 [Blastocatellia bacterium]|jgi:hypothetical protein|nr:hypothetical protein [Blastocatellia bacterium]
MRVVSLMTAVIICTGELACGQSGRATTSNYVTQDETPIMRRAPAPPHPRWKPPVTLQRAVRLVGDYIEKEKMDISSHYLAEVRMISNDRGKEDKGPLWYFFWNHSGTVDGRQLEFTVAMDGKVTRLASW